MHAYSVTKNGKLRIELCSLSKPEKLSKIRITSSVIIFKLLEWKLVLGPVLVNILMNKTDTGIECSSSKFADNTKLNGAVVIMLEGGDVIQRDCHRLEMCTNVDLIKFNKAK